MGVLYQNDDVGKDHITGLRLGLVEQNAGMVVKTVSYEVTDPTLDQQVVTLKESGADAVLLVTLPKFAALSIRKIHDIGWKPLIILACPGASIPGALKPAGLDPSTGAVIAELVRPPGNPQWDGDPEMLAYLAFMKAYAPELDPTDKLSVFGYSNAAMVVALLKACGDNLTRENLLEQATHRKDVKVPMLLPGILLNTTPEDCAPIKQMQLQRFDGTRWVPTGGVLEG